MLTKRKEKTSNHHTANTTINSSTLFLLFRLILTVRFLLSSSSLVWNSDKTTSDAPIVYSAHDSQPYFTSSLQRKSVIVNLLEGVGKAIYVLLASFGFIFNSHPWQLFLRLSKLHTGKAKTSECYHAQVGLITPNSFLRYIQRITLGICWTLGVCTAPVQQAQLFSCSAFSILETSERTWPTTGADNKPLQIQPHFYKSLGDFSNNQQAANAYYLKIQFLL